VRDSSRTRRPRRGCTLTARSKAKEDSRARDSSEARRRAGARRAAWIALRIGASAKFDPFGSALSTSIPAITSRRDSPLIKRETSSSKHARFAKVGLAAKFSAEVHDGLFERVQIEPQRLRIWFEELISEAHKQRL